MTPEKQRIAIAEACQGKIELYEGNWYYWDSSMNRHLCRDNNPLNDLNAMHAAFEHLGKYWRITNAENKFICTVLFAKQRKDVVVSGPELGPVMAEAFLRTLNLWEE